MSRCEYWLLRRFVAISTAYACGAAMGYSITLNNDYSFVLATLATMASIEGLSRSLDETNI